MKALMFGWEFPPHILGGLGTASYGLTKGMAENGNMDISFRNLMATRTKVLQKSSVPATLPSAGATPIGTMLKPA